MIRRSKRHFKHYYNLARWSNIGVVKSGFLMINRLLITIFKQNRQPSMNHISNDFDSYTRSYGYNNEKLKSMADTAYYVSLLYLILSVICFFYFIYLAVSEKYLGLFLSGSMTFFFLSYFFHQSYLSVSVRSRNMKPSFQLWFRHCIRKGDII